MLDCAFMRLEQTVAERSERIRLSKESNGWSWHAEVWFKAGVHPYTDEGEERWKWLARRRAEAAVRRMRPRLDDYIEP